MRCQWWQELASLRVRAKPVSRGSCPGGVPGPGQGGRTETSPCRTPTAEVGSLALLQRGTLMKIRRWSGRTVWAALPTSSFSLSLLQCQPRVMTNTKHILTGIRPMQKPQASVRSMKLRVNAPVSCWQYRSQSFRQDLGIFNPCFITLVVRYCHLKTVQGCREQSHLVRTTPARVSLPWISKSC